MQGSVHVNQVRFVYHDFQIFDISTDFCLLAWCTFPHPFMLRYSHLHASLGGTIVCFVLFFVIQPDNLCLQLED